MKIEDKYKVHGKIVYSSRTKTGCAVTIMPDEIVIDNYHGKGGHIHPDPTNHDIQKSIKSEDRIINLKIVLHHLNKNKTLKLNELIEELRK
ncbi:hypothetical protein [Methanobrevibacter filiformis]|uniref:Uncharacterized protein n=1 Tax=Methanobrevibacter filiformis TaxID=55758 RepID=A0A166FG18_9EURY|nr:hypothetical protein [Methanobrevibacter filiformis]KZX17638.1 hypothetical protein MBFIL_00250 [Methanobrevibacter filiformis]